MPLDGYRFSYMNTFGNRFIAKHKTQGKNEKTAGKYHTKCAAVLNGFFAVVKIKCVYSRKCRLCVTEEARFSAPNAEQSVRAEEEGNPFVQF